MPVTRRRVGFRVRVLRATDSDTALRLAARGCVTVLRLAHCQWHSGWHLSQAGPPGHHDSCWPSLPVRRARIPSCNMLLVFIIMINCGSHSCFLDSRPVLLATLTGPGLRPTCTPGQDTFRLGDSLAWYQCVNFDGRLPVVVMTQRPGPSLTRSIPPPCTAAAASVSGTPPA